MKLILAFVSNILFNDNSYVISIEPGFIYAANIIFNGVLVGVNVNVGVLVCVGVTLGVLVGVNVGVWLGDIKHGYVDLHVSQSTYISTTIGPDGEPWLTNVGELTIS